MELRAFILLLLMVPLSLRAQTVDSSRVNRPLGPNPARASTTTPPSSAPPLTTQEMSQIVNSVGGGSHPGVMVRTIDNRYEGLRGTPYFLNDWSKGQIEMIDGKRFVDVPIKFDAFRQALILLRPKMGNDSIIIDRQSVSQFRLVSTDGQEYVFRRYPGIKSLEAEGTYFLVLYEGKNSLLKRIVKTFQGADYKQPYSNNIRYDTFNNDFAYFILRPDNTLVRVKKSKKAIYEALSDKGANFEEFAAQEKLNFKTDTDFAKIVKYYDEL